MFDGRVLRRAHESTNRHPGASARKTRARSFREGTASTWTSAGSHFRGARHEVVLPDDVVVEVLGGDLLKLAPEGDELSWFALEHLDQAEHRSGVTLEKDAIVCRTQPGEEHDRAVEDQVRDCDAKAVAHDGRVPPLGRRRHEGGGRG